MKSNSDKIRGSLSLRNMGNAFNERELNPFHGHTVGTSLQTVEQTDELAVLTRNDGQYYRINISNNPSGEGVF